MTISDDDCAVVYDDGELPFDRPDYVYTPQSLRLIGSFLAELNREEIADPKSFNANLPLYLDSIIGHFRSFHDMHAAAQAVHRAYRTTGRQYGLYLRSFSLGGFESMDLGPGNLGSGVVATQFLTSHDKEFRGIVKAALPGGLECISFVNTLDAYWSGNAVGDGADYVQRTTLPSFRLLSHNWKGIVREVVRGACFVVVNAWGSTPGVEYELTQLMECGMANRTILVRHGTCDLKTELIGAFHETIELDNRGLASDSAGAKKLTDAVRRFSEDGFRQTNEVSDLSELRCWVVDRRIDAAAKSFNAETLARVARYDYFIPRSLAGNWAHLTEGFPQMIEKWRAIEATMEKRGKLVVEEVADAMYAALSVFYVATTLERYYEMAISLSTVGMAHRAITGDTKIMTVCYQHAAQCAKWLGDVPLHQFFTAAQSVIEREAGTRPGRADTS